MSNDYYQILGVANNASDKDIRDAYRALIRRLQEDPSPTAQDQIEQVNRAFEILSDPTDRSKYDASATNENSQATNSIELNTHDQTPIAAPTNASKIKRKNSAAPGWLINLLILVIGITIGFFGRPIVIPYPPDPQAVAMQTVLSTTRHYKGDANAPVTIIEFGDFQ